MTTPSSYDALVIGAGPAGTAAATILAGAGRRVALLERHRGKRYRIGESLIPYCWYPLERLGLVDAVARSGFVVEKNSVQFASPEGKVSKAFYFFQHTDHPCARTWQVVRSEFDALLAENAERKGVELLDGTVARELLEDSSGAIRGVKARSEEHGELELVAPLTIDASGRDTLAQSRLGWRVPDPELRKMAIWTYYRGARRESGIDEGTTTIAYIEGKGWFWYIPLPDDLVSVGVVADKDHLYRDTKDAEAIFQRELQGQHWVKERLATGTVVDEYRVTSEFSYRARHIAKDGLVLTGDAFAFLDPVFSSGVYFALWGGVQAADAGLAALEAGDVSAARFEAYAAEYRKQMEPMRRLVHAFYDPEFNFGRFLKRHPDMRYDLTDCLIGNLDRDYEPFFSAVSELAALPEPLSHGTVENPTGSGA